MNNKQRNIQKYNKIDTRTEKIPNQETNKQTTKQRHK